MNTMKKEAAELAASATVDAGRPVTVETLRQLVRDTVRTVRYYGGEMDAKEAAMEVCMNSHLCGECGVWGVEAFVARAAGVVIGRVEL